jgi:Flp pilus assembly protein TadD
LETRNKPDEAALHYYAAIGIKPDFAEAHENLGELLIMERRFPQAGEQFAAAVKLQPASAAIHYGLGNARLLQNNFRGAAEEYSEAVRLQPENFEANFNLALALTKLGRTAGAIQYYNAALALKPETVPALQKLAWLLATDPDPQLRDAAKAVQLATRATQLAPSDPAAWDTQAAALAENGQYQDATASAAKALTLAAGNKEYTKEIQGRLQLYQSGAPYHQSPAK